MSCKSSIVDINKEVYRIEKGQSAAPIIRECHNWLLRTKHPDPPYDAAASQRDKYTVFETEPDVSYLSDRDPREVSRLYKCVQNLYMIM